MSPTSATRPSTTRTDARRAGAPVPSMSSALAMTKADTDCATAVGIGCDTASTQMARAKLGMPREVDLRRVLSPDSPSRPRREKHRAGARACAAAGRLGTPTRTTRASGTPPRPAPPRTSQSQSVPLIGTPLSGAWCQRSSSVLARRAISSSAAAKRERAWLRRDVSRATAAASPMRIASASPGSGWPS